MISGIPSPSISANVPLLGLGTNAISPSVDTIFTPTLLTSIIIVSEPSVIQTSLAVTMHSTVSVVLKLFVKVAAVAPATMFPFISHW